MFFLWYSLLTIITIAFLFYLNKIPYIKYKGKRKFYFVGKYYSLFVSSVLLCTLCFGSFFFGKYLILGFCLCLLTFGLYFLFMYFSRGVYGVK